MPNESLFGDSDQLTLPGVAPLTSKPMPKVEAPKPPPELRTFGDAIQTRKNIFGGVESSIKALAPMEDDRHILSLHDVEWVDPDRFTRAQRKAAVLKGETLARRMKGTWILQDKLSGKVLDHRRQVIASVPYMTSLGTFTHNGTDYTLNHQQRLAPGIFARKKDNGELESHVNVLPGQGTAHRYFLDPAKGVFKMKIGQAELPLMPLLRAAGVTDQQFRQHWGDQLTATNTVADDATVLKKLRERLLSKKDLLTKDQATLNKELVHKFINMALDPEVTEATLGKRYDRLTPEAILAATSKLVKVHKGEAESDDRDHLAFQTFHGPEDLFRERIERDQGRVRRNVFREISRLGNLSKMPSGLMTSQLNQTILGSGLGQSIEEINPLEVLDKQTRITRMGEGGIPSTDSVPDEARSVQPSHLGFLDSIRTPESFRVGIDLHFARGSRKGNDGRIYTSLMDPKTGQTTWKSPRELVKSSIATPDAMKWDTDLIPVMKAGKIDYVPKAEVDYVVPHFEDTFSALGNLIPMKSAAKQQRLAMGSRYVTQALPLKNPEAPLVRGMTPDGKSSFEDEYGTHAGAIKASKGGRVIDATPDGIKVKYDDGTTETHELYNNHPFSRKTFIHQTPTVQPGDVFKPGQLLARSNYTDEKGATAIGANFRTAYIPWHGMNFKDAIVISESAAKRMSSEHAYQHQLDMSDLHKVGKNNFLSFFPAKYEREQLDQIDHNGLIKVGSVVREGQPLILAAKQRELALNRIHKKGQPGYTDASITWDHHDEGIVTDVVQGKEGPVVVVKAHSPMKVGDKLSGRYGDKGVVAGVIPDEHMPHGQDGKPYEVLLSPTGIISRCYDELTEFLTQAGWKRGRDVTPEDVFLTFDPVTTKTQWGPQIAPFYVADYAGPMLRFRASHVDMLVTPNHKMWARPESSDTWIETTAERIAFHRWWVPTVGSGAVPGIEQPFVVPELPRHVKDTQSTRGPISLDAGDFAAFLGWYVAEGHTTFNVPRNKKTKKGKKSRQKGEYKVFLAQDENANPAKCEEIAALLDRLPFRWKYKHSTQQFVINSKRLAAWTKKLGYAHEKYVPEWLFGQPSAIRQRFLDAYWKGDGHDGESDTGEYKTASSVSERLIDGLQILWQLQGFAAIKRTVKVDPRHRPMWRCAVMLRKTDRLLSIRGWSKEEYAGRIYCPSVATGYIVTRRNGKPLIAGNTNPAQKLEAWLGKVARKTGQPIAVPDFKDIDDLTEWTEQKLRQHGLSAVEDIVDPTTGRKIKATATGERFLMKLHHTAESKAAGRDSGGYTADEMPSKGGESGCFVNGTLIDVIDADGTIQRMPIEEITNNKRQVRVPSVEITRFDDSQAVKGFKEAEVIDWFTFRTNPEDLVEVELENGEKIQVTQSHVFYLADGTAIQAGDLEPGMDLLSDPI